ncbi:MAG: cyclic nucleotide-binding domain-containing protein [Nitrospirae bacterium]|nr:cyclic nucleotide-binding domain-containing protein [Nitrospirota bacterium]
MSLVEDLKNQNLFQEMTGDELSKIAPVLQLMSVAKGQFVFKENDSTRGIYMLLSGKVEIKRKLQLDTKTKMLIMLRNLQSDEVRHTAQGWENRFAIIEAGNFFGELSVIENRKKHSAEAIAIENAELALLKTEDFNELEMTHPETMVKLMKSVAKAMSNNVRLLDKRILKALMGQ